MHFDDFEVEGRPEDFRGFAGEPEEGVDAGGIVGGPDGGDFFGGAQDLFAFGIGMVSDSTWALIASQLRSWFVRKPRRGEAMGAVGGASMIGLGVGLALTGDPR